MALLDNPDRGRYIRPLFRPRRPEHTISIPPTTEHARQGRRTVERLAAEVSLIIVSILAVSCASTSHRRTSPSVQNPSPMVEHARSHERIENVQLPGSSFVLDGVLPKPVVIYVPRPVEGRGDFRVLIHFHGAPYVPEGRVLAEGGTLDTAKLSPFLEFALGAVRGEKEFLLTHSEIFPGTYASTTETADYIIRSLALKRTPVLRWGPLGMQQISEVHRGHFSVLGYAGNTAPDHLDHLHGLFYFLGTLFQTDAVR